MLLLGGVWREQESIGLSRYLLARIGKSILISWFCFFVAYWLNFGPLLTSGLLAVLVVGAIFVQYRYPSLVLIDRSVISVVGKLLLIGAALLCINLMLGGINDSYRPIFQTNDAVQSWNRWAIELSNNDYNPYNAAYPVLFPALWSLIYKVQESAQIWIVAKSTLLIFPFLLVLLIAVLLEDGLLLAAAALSAFCYFFFIERYLFHTFIGDMDIPAMIMILVSGCTIYLAQLSIEGGNKLCIHTTIIASIFAGLAAITKQSGIIALIPIFAYLVINLYDKKISYRLAIFSVAITLAPILSFLTIFLHETTQIAGNLNQLKTLSAAASGALDTSKMVVSVEYLKAMLPLPFLSVLLSLSILNLFMLHRRTGQLGLVFCLCGAIGFFVFADCCSYDQRNGWWVLAMFMVSSMFALGHFGSVKRETPPTIEVNKNTFICATILTAILSAGLSLPLSDKRLEHIQQAYQWKLLPDEVSYILKTRSALLKESGKFISNNYFVKWLPGFDPLFSGCELADSKCIIDTIENHPNSMVLLVAGSVTKFKGLEKLLGQNRLNGSIGGYELYGPFTIEDVRRSTDIPL